jgi:hypothetical protein
MVHAAHVWLPLLASFYLHPAMHLASAVPDEAVRSTQASLASQDGLVLAGRLGTSAGDGAVLEIRRARLGLPLVHIAGGATSAPRRPSHPLPGKERRATPRRIFSTSNSSRTPRTSSEIGISGDGGVLLFLSVF